MTLQDIINKYLEDCELTPGELATEAGVDFMGVHNASVMGIYNMDDQEMVKLSVYMGLPANGLKFYTLDPQDMPEDRRHLYDLMKPVIDGLIGTILDLRE